MPSTVSTVQHWASRTMGSIAVLFLAFDTIIKVVAESHAVESTVQLGFPESSVVAIGVIELISLSLYIIPRTSVLGLMLMTGYLGGAVAIQFRAGSPLFSHTFFPIYIAIFLWGALYLREPRLRQLIPFNTAQTTT